MSKRDHDTEIWEEDWFLGLGSANQLFWFYIKDKCDNAGFWRPNFRLFESLTGHRINQKEFMEKVNTDVSFPFKERVKVLENGKWFITGFIKFHFNGVLNLGNRFHASVFSSFSKNLNGENSKDYGFEVKERSIRPLLDLRRQRIRVRVKDKSKGKEKELIKELLIPDYLKESIAAFIEHRKKNKRPMTDHAVKLIVEKVQKLYPSNNAMQIAAINQSIERGWQGVFAIKEEQKTKKFWTKEDILAERREKEEEARQARQVNRDGKGLMQVGEVMKEAGL